MSREGAEAWFGADGGQDERGTAVGGGGRRARAERAAIPVFYARTELLDMTARAGRPGRGSWCGKPCRAASPGMPHELGHRDIVLLMAQP